MKLFITCILLISIMGCSKLKLIEKKLTDVAAVRIVTLYSPNGSIIQQWETSEWYTSSGSLKFKNNNDNKRIIISGTFTVIQK